MMASHEDEGFVEDGGNISTTASGTAIDSTISAAASLYASSRALAESTERFDEQLLRLTQRNGENLFPRGFTTDQNEDIVFQLIQALPVRNITNIYQRINPLIHHDFCQIFPDEVIHQIFSYLSYRDVLIASCVSKLWQRYANHPILWMKLYFKEGWSANIERINELEKFYRSPVLRNNFNLNFAAEYHSWGQNLEPSSIIFNDEMLGEDSVSEGLLESVLRGQMYHQHQDQQLRNEAQTLRFPTRSNGHISEQHYQPNSSHSWLTAHTLRLFALQYGKGVHFNWKLLFRYHLGLDSNWLRSRCTLIRLDRGNNALNSPVSAIQALDSCVYCLQFDHNRLVSGGRDFNIYIWNLTTRQIEQCLSGHKGSVLCLKYFPGESALFSGSSDCRILEWDFQTGSCNVAYVGHTESVLSIQIDKAYIVSCSKDRTIRIWRRNQIQKVGLTSTDDSQSQGLDEMRTVNSPERVISGHESAVNSIHLDSQNGRIISASGDRTIKIWSIYTGECIRTITGHTRGIACVEMWGDIIVSGSSDTTVMMFDVNTGEHVRVLRGHDLLVRTLQTDGCKIVSGSYDSSIKIWSFNKNQSSDRNPLLCNLKCSSLNSRIFKLQFDEYRIISCSQDGQLLIWDFSGDLDCTFF